MRRGSLAVRFRRMNTMIFGGALFVMATMMVLLLNATISTISAEYAQQYALNSSEVVSEHVYKELSIMSQIAKSDVVTQWLEDEGNEDKTTRAVEEMLGIINNLYSYNLYVGLEKSHCQYKIGLDHAKGDIYLVDELDDSDPTDKWYFNTIDSDSDYEVGIGIDKDIERKRVWIDYKVTKDGVPLGVISTGLEFSHLVGEIFTQYERGNMRGLIIDDQGMIFMDSALAQDRDFLYNEFQAQISDVFKNADLAQSVESFLKSEGLHTNETVEPVVVSLKSGPYSRAAIMPIKGTHWTVVILSGGLTLFGISYFFPILITVLILFFIIALVTSAANYRLIFLPLNKLDQSLVTLRENTEGHIYGLERDDELGDLSRTIQDLFLKANVDALTGIKNRRFMENNFVQKIDILSRANGLLSVLMIDIDFFKKYNDTYGHSQGDVCLKEVARAISSGILRMNDFVARYGGEEFVVVLPSTDENGARIVADKLLKKVSDLNIPHSNSVTAPYVTVSIGLTTGRVVFSQNWKEYINRADEALYISKKNGRNQATFLDM
ncbi:MAG: diguanylate cyclase [Oscillospiraceae bacterium]|nr:diguanylate cyclase [Oscillospiraceae bacterium]